MAFPILDPMFHEMVKHRASDLYLTVGFPPTLRVSDRLLPISENKLTDTDIESIIDELLEPEKREEFSSSLEFNGAVNWDSGSARFRINIFRQQKHNGLVIRRIQTEIPTLASLKLPAIYADLAMEKRGLVLVVGPTGSGKSSSLAAMIEHRNSNGSGHIVTVEDPIEFVHEHRGCIVTQRDVGIDTYSYGLALKNALRQRPDVVLIGEIRDRETMEHAINFSETGHLCFATLHANNANQTIERILSFFPEDKHRQVLLNLAMNMRAILSQRLVLTKNNERAIALEVLLNRGLVKSLIEEGRVKEIRETMEKNRVEGMCTFEQALLELYMKGEISEEVAVSESDNPANLRLQIKQQQMSRTLNPGAAAAGTAPMAGGYQHFKI